MRNFGAVSPLFWTGKTGRLLRADRDAQVVALYLMTAPSSHQTGIYYLPVAYISNDTGIPIEGASKALTRVIQGGFCLYDASAEWIWVREMAIWQIGEPTSDADKRVVGLQNYYANLPNLSFLPDFFDRYEKVFRLKTRRDSTDFPKPLTSPFDGPCKPHRSQDQDQDQEQETEQESEGDARGRMPADAVLDAPPSDKAKVQREKGAEGKPRETTAIRLPVPWPLTDERRAVAVAERLEPERTHAKFCDYWHAASGAKARKLDWEATWRNWCRNETDRNHSNGNGSVTKESYADRSKREFMERMAERDKREEAEATNNANP